MENKFIRVTVLALLLGACSPNGTLTQNNGEFNRNAVYKDPRGIDPDSNPDRTYIVGMNPFNKSSSQFEKARSLHSLSMDVSLKVEALNDEIITVEFSPGASVQQSLDKMISSPDVAFIEPNYKVFPIAVPNDPEISKQWAHNVIKSSEAWDISTGNDDIVVAVIDTGIDYNHPDLKEHIWNNSAEVAGNGRDDDGNGLTDDIRGWDFANNDSDPMDDVEHGTHVAGTIGAVCNNSSGICGHAQRLKLMPLKFLGTNGGDVKNGIKAIEYAISKRVKIMSNSWGGSQGSQALAQVITKAEQAGIMFIAAAGNESRNADQQPSYPAAYTNNNIISVAATDSGDNLARFSNYGVQSVDIGAPGVSIYSTVPNGRYKSMDGTSMATPLVSGVVALLYAIKPDAKICEIRRALLSSVDVVSSLQGKVASNGRINALKAVQSMKTISCTGPNPTPGPTPTPTPTPTPGSGIAKQPTLNGQLELSTSNPNNPVTIAFDISEFGSQGAAGAYIEISQPNREFSNPNGDSPDPQRLTYAMVNGLTGNVTFVPARTLPNWGTYAFRVIPLNNQRFPVGKFSNSSHLKLMP